MKNVFKFLSILIILLVAKLLYNEYKLSQTSHFTITSDTNVSAIPGLSKYVTQEEVDSFSFRYWDIDNNYTKWIDPLLLPLRSALKDKNTTKVLNYLKEHNLSVDVKIEDGTTPLMYSSFYDDINTTKELIKLGANIHQKDKYKLSPLAYAISMNNIDIVKILHNNGVKFEDVPFVQGSLIPQTYGNIKSLTIKNDDIEITYKYNWDRFKNGDARGGAYLFDYLIIENFLDLAKMVLKSNYKPYAFFVNRDDVKFGNSIYDVVSKETIDLAIKDTKDRMGEKFDLQSFMDKFSYNYTLYKELENIPNYEPMLELMLKYNVAGQPTKEQLKEAYDECYRGYVSSILGGYDIDGDRYYMKYESLTRNLYQEYCPDKNGSFNIKTYINYMNKKKKYEVISRLLYLHSNCDDKNSKTYKGGLACKYYTKQVFFDDNNTKFEVKPYKKLSSDEIKEIVDWWYQVELPRRNGEETAKINKQKIDLQDKSNSNLTDENKNENSK
ncbi:ankyrin repeat domain-containing protein [Campylobacter geochelonis]|uniref:ankyrin repeat domain-containing protein n=1 Tax=Campylobacter geochelonis TaxID=1780362 RepID=UPI000770B60F|nr:ankyrin repeat domain-containing protein [Campylobacter geochelonis]CZE48104.1 ankyrin repeat-containing protein [Campylobacter geochelonis]